LKEIKVELAGNVVTTMLMNNANTVLGPEGTQLIVPLIPIMKQLGCTLSTNEYGGMQLMHPSIGVLPIDDSTGTPLLPGKMCQHLIKELEEDTKRRGQEDKAAYTMLKMLLSEMERQLEEEPVKKEESEPGEEEEEVWIAVAEDEVKEVFHEEEQKIQEEKDEIKEAREEAIKAEETYHSQEETAEAREALELEEMKNYVMSRMTDEWYGPTQKGELLCISRTARKKKVNPQFREDCPVRSLDWRKNE
jgi:hypothetical protein